MKLCLAERDMAHDFYFDSTYVVACRNPNPNAMMYVFSVAVCRSRSEHSILFTPNMGIQTVGSSFMYTCII